MSLKSKPIRLFIIVIASVLVGAIALSYVPLSEAKANLSSSNISYITNHNVLK